jgi:hypothetical protein
MKRNQFLSGYHLPIYNRRFSEAAEGVNLHRPIPQTQSNDILCIEPSGLEQ